MRHGVRVPPQHLAGGRECKKYTTIMAEEAVIPWHVSSGGSSGGGLKGGGKEDA